MKALVTGGGGFLGRYIVEMLAQRGDRVRVFSRRRYPELDPLGVESTTGDLRDPEAVNRAVSGQDAVFHVAAVPGIWGAWQTFYGINTQGTQHVIEACQRHQVSRLVYTSSPSVVFDGRDHCGADESLPYPRSFQCHYPRSKALAEQAVLAANDDRLATVALRPHLIWGPRDNHLIPRLLDRAAGGKLRQVGDGSNRVSMAYVENVADAHLLAADALSPGSAVAGQAYFINDPEPVNLWSWVNGLLERLGRPAITRKISHRAAAGIGCVCESLYCLLRLTGEPPMTRFLAAQLAGSHFYNVDKARRDFGFRLLVSVEDGMERLEAELRKTVSARQGSQ